MTWATLGSLALPFTLQKSGVQSRLDLNRLSTELTTGRVESPARHLRGDIGMLHAIENRLSRITGFDTALKQTVTAFDTAQSALDLVAQAGKSLGEKLVITSQSTAGADARTVAASAARSVLDEIVSALSVTVAGRAVFSGTVTDRTPLASREALIAALAPEVAGMTNAADVTAALQAWFMDPGTGFADAVYRGGPAAVGGLIDDAQPGPALPTAEDPAIRRQMMAAAMVVLVDDGALNLNDTQARTVMQTAMTTLLGNAADVAALQARVGVAQEVLDQRQLRLSLERDRLEQLRSDKIGADPYTTATALERARVQLESIYTLTSRLSRLTLTEYLR